MKKNILFLLLILTLLLTGCKDDSPAGPPEQDDIPVETIPEGTIPVVFHLLYEDSANEAQNPSQAVIEQRVDQMNKFYASTLFTESDIPGVPSQKIGVTFTLATYDPSGKPLAQPGINRVKYAGAANMGAEDFLYSSSLTAQNKPIFWDPNRYVNIWLFSFLVSSDEGKDESAITGISFLPYCTTLHPLFGLNGDRPEEPGENYYNMQPGYMHGLALNNRYFLPPAGVDPFDQKGLVNEDEGLFTLCHEMGHYLGLKHAFYEVQEDSVYDGCANPDNASDDGCEDTPKYDRLIYMATIQPALDGEIKVEELPYHPYWRQSCAGELFCSTNVMDYFYGMRTQLTPNQNERIDHVMKYSPLIPRSSVETKALLGNMTGKISGKLPEPILMRCYGGDTHRH